MRAFLPDGRAVSRGAALPKSLAARAVAVSEMLILDRWMAILDLR
jgi:hypothetical protein